MKKNNILLALIIVIISFIPILSLFHPGFPLTHDGQDHVARIANFYKNLQEGIIIPRWAGNLNWGYGHPVLEFLYPLPSYIASFFHFAGFSLVDSTKIVFGLGMILSLIFMYLWLSLFTSRYSAIFGSILYTYAPYRFVETYVRGDIGENLAFVFIPLVLLFIYKLYRKNNYAFVLFGAISLALLILAHNAISLMLMPFIIIYSLLLIYLSKDRKSLSLNLLLLIVIGFALSLFFWFPALFEGKYTLRNIVTQGGYISRFVSLGTLIYGPWNYGQSGQFTVQFGLFQWIALIFSPLVILKFKKDKEKFYLAIILLIFTILSAFLMLPWSSLLWAKIMLLQNFQFPWRFLAIIVFSTAVLGALFFELIPKKLKLFSLLIFGLIIFIISSFYWYPKGYLYKNESFYTGIYNGTTDTGESSPIWSIRGMEHRPKAPLAIIDGYASIKELKRTSAEHDYLINAKSKTLFIENTLYFPGWAIYDNNKSIPIEFQNVRYEGIMTFSLNKGVHEVKVLYEDTKIRQISNLISFLTLIIILGLFGIKLRRTI